MQLAKGKGHLINKRTNSEIICIQETHIKKEHAKFVENPKVGKLFTSSDSKKKEKIFSNVREARIITEIKLGDEGWKSPVCRNAVGGWKSANCEHVCTK